MERNNISLILLFQPPQAYHTPNPPLYPYPQMKHNNIIDFFSSPNSRFIGFSDIRHPPQEIPHPEYEPLEEQRKYHRKLSFTVSGMVEPIMPFEVDFFQEKLEECEEPQEYSQEKEQMEINENSMIIEAQLGRTVGYQLQFLKSPHIHPKQPQYLSTPHTMRIEHQTPHSSHPMPLASSHCQPPNTPQLFSTPLRKSYQLFSARKSCDSTAEKSISRNNQKGLRRLSSLAYSIVSQSTTTTYKEVAQKLLNHLNFNSTDMDEQDGPDRSSMQNVKRRVYDSLNVLLALGVIKRVGSKIAKQKQRKPFTADTSPDLQKYNEMLVEYNQRVKALDMRLKTQQQLKEKLETFRRTVQRNRKTKHITKGNNNNNINNTNNNKMIRLPFLAFVSNQEAQVEWVRKETTVVTTTDATQKKKPIKRGQRNQNQKITQQQDQCVKVSFKGCPESYGDLDLFRLLQQEEVNLIISKQTAAQFNIPVHTQQLQDFQYDQRYNSRLKRQEDEMNLIDEVLGE